ncbi:MAG: hypothetical protein ABSA39_13325 [Edaphobacter sp.]
MAPDTQSIAFNEIFPTSDMPLAFLCDSSAGHAGYADSEILSAAIKRVDLDDEEEFDDDEEEDDFDDEDEDEGEEDEDEDEDGDDEDDEEYEDDDDEEDEEDEDEEKDGEEDELNLI